MNRSSFVSKLFTPVITLLVLAYFGYHLDAISAVQSVRILREVF